MSGSRRPGHGASATPTRPSSTTTSSSGRGCRASPFPSSGPGCSWRLSSSTNSTLHSSPSAACTSPARGPSLTRTPPPGPAPPRIGTATQVDTSKYFSGIKYFWAATKIILRRFSLCRPREPQSGDSTGSYFAKTCTLIQGCNSPSCNAENIHVIYQVNPVSLLQKKVIMSFDHGNFIWNLVNADEKTFDTKILCSDGYVITNKCFLTLASKFISCVCDTFSLLDFEDAILLTDFSCYEVFILTNKYSVIFRDDHVKATETHDDLGQPKRKNDEENFGGADDGRELKMSNLDLSMRDNRNSPSGEILNPVVSRSRSTSKICPICGLLFQSAAKLTHHKYDVHPKVKDKFECLKCFMKFPYQHLLNKHNLRKHSDLKFFCSHCSKLFSLKSNLLKHQKKFHSLVI